MIQELNGCRAGLPIAWRLLVGVNVLAAAASGAFGVAGAVAPGLLVGRRVRATPDITFFAAMYGVRAVALAATVIVVAVRARPGQAGALRPLIALAGLVQAGDAVLATVHRTPGATGAALAAAVHLGSMTARSMGGRPAR